MRPRILLLLATLLFGVGLIGCDPVPKEVVNQFGDHSPTWSPGGDSILYVHDSTSGEPGGLYSVNVTTKVKRLLKPGVFASVDWSPEDNNFLFDQYGTVYLYVLPYDQSDAVTQGTEPKWSP
ncbi:MAG TPA: hypothetical protein VGR66_10710, partial [Candidatus Eisenbacteria bacterium]|nr:hypothetical protein [Candidatus Eisenbacteria bacterium]